jgi:hypothetical protein
MPPSFPGQAIRESYCLAVAVLEFVTEEDRCDW